MSDNDIAFNTMVLTLLALGFLIMLVR